MNSSTLNGKISLILDGQWLMWLGRVSHVEVVMHLKDRCVVSVVVMVVDVCVVVVVVVTMDVVVMILIHSHVVVVVVIVDVGVDVCVDRRVSLRCRVEMRIGSIRVHQRFIR